MRLGQAQHRDYLEHHDHQPSDQYVRGMDFMGDGKLPTFGYELGVQAASELPLIGWLPGDEFQAARKKSRARSAILRGQSAR